MFVAVMPIVTVLKCNSMNNQECKIRPKTINVNSNKPLFYPYSLKIDKCSGSCNNINDSFAKLCVPDVIKNLNVKVFNLMSRTNENRYVEWHETCKCTCRLHASARNNKQRWNNDKYQCESKELTDKEVCDKGFIWKSSNSECECDESCNCWKRLIDKLVEECVKNIDENKFYLNEANSHSFHSCERRSCTVYVFYILNN